MTCKKDHYFTQSSLIYIEQKIAKLQDTHPLGWRPLENPPDGVFKVIYMSRNFLVLMGFCGLLWFVRDGAYGLA
jgi:hypothetical protein